MKRTKKKVKLTKFAKLLLLIITLLLVFGIYSLLNKDNKGKNNSNNTKPDTKNETKKPTVKKEKNMFEDETYYLEKNLERYQSYYNDHKDLRAKEIVKRVNSNIDKEFYVDVEKADLSKGNLILVNKFNYVDSNYTPSNMVELSGYGNGSLVKEAYDAYVELYNDALKDGMHLFVSTSYRNYGFQSTLYNNYVAEDGVENADTYSARPGYSEHHTGLAVDLATTYNRSITQFGYTDEYKWMQKNAYKYGFIQRYTDENQYITGYLPEEWHYRYVGKDIAKYIYENNITYEEYYAYFIDK